MPREQLREDVAQKRLNFQIARRFADSRSFVFLDESGAKTNMTRLYGWSNMSNRCIDYTPHGHWKTSTMISAIRSNQVIEEATFLIDGAMTGERFLGYVQNHLAPNLKSGEIVVMDNLAAHKCEGVREAIESVGCELWYLPPYSPDLNPIEKLWSKVKAYLRRAALRDWHQITQAVKDAIRAVSPKECCNYFNSCGYTM